MYSRSCRWLVLAALLLQACSSGTTDEAPGGATTGESRNNGAVQVSLTDAPAFGYDHVWITVRDLWFNTSDSAKPEQAGWIKFPLSAPVTLDLLSLGNGSISVPVWDDITLPEGNYAQMRIFLVRTDAPLSDAAQAEGLSYNNQVDVSGAAAAYPLRVPGADRGIMLTGTFTVRKNEKLKLAVDFDAGHDVVEIERDGKTEYVLKPRLAYFDLDNAGAIVGSLDAAAAANNAAGRFVIKAEQLAPNGLVHLVRRVTVLAGSNGSFTLYPLLPGTYDIVLRGLNYDTTIIKGVPVTKGTKPDQNPTVIPVVTMTQAGAPDYPIDATIVSPTGAWLHFFQKLADDPAPYEIRFRHFNPLTGRIFHFPLASGPLRVGMYAADAVISLQTVTPEGGNGSYRVVAGAPLFEPDLSGAVVTSTTGTVAFGTLNVKTPATVRSASGSIIVPQSFAAGFLDRGVLFATHGGIIVHAIGVDSQMTSGGAYTISNLPGGTAEHPLPGAHYGIEAFGWLAANPLNRAVAAPAFVDLSVDDATGIDLTMEMR